MLDKVNYNNDEIANQQLMQQNKVSKLATNPIGNAYSKLDGSLLIDESYLSNEAMTKYERECDIKRFTSLAMSDSDDMSHEEIINELFSKGVLDPFSDEAVSNLVNNNKFLEELGL